MSSDSKMHSHELETQNKALMEENKRLKEHSEDVLLLGSVAEGISGMETVESILQYTLERISIIKAIPYCAFYELRDNEAFVCCSHFVFEREGDIEDEIKLPQNVLDSLTGSIKIYSGDNLQASGITLTQKGSSFTPLRVMLIPLSTRLIQQGVLILADDDASQDKLSAKSNLFTRVLQILVNRLDNLSLVQELQHLNLALNMEIDRRTDELHETNKKLSETTEQRTRVEEALLRQRDIVSNISEASPVGITILDKNGEITYANARAETVLGLSKSEIMGRKYNASEWKITDYEGNPFPENQIPFVKVMATGHPVYNIRHAIEWPDGKRVFLAINAAPVFDDEFRLDGIVAVIDDVTQEVTVDTEFRKLQTFNTNIVQNVTEGIIVEDSGEIITFVNPAAAKILGYKPEELIGENVVKIIPEDQREIVRSANKRRKRGESDRYEIVILCKDGSRVSVLVSASPRIDARSGKFLGSLAVFTDITERKAAEQLNRIQRDLALKLSAITGLDTVLQLCLRTAIQAADLDAGGIYLTNKHNADIYLACSEGLSPNFLEKASYYPADSPNVHLMMQGEPVYLSYTDLNLPLDDFRVQDKLLSVASLPIKFEGQIIAFLNVASRTSDKISQSSKNILEAIAAQIGSAVARTQAEEQLRQRVDQLALINDIGEKIAAILDLEAVLSRTALLVQENFNFEHVGLFLIDRNRKAVVMKTIAGTLAEFFPPDHSLEIGEGLVGTAALENKIVLANDVTSDPRYVNLYPKSVNTRAELSVPIQIGREVVGVIDAQSTHPNAFTESDIIVMETLADQVAVAIHNANLHEAVQRELDERTRVETALRESEEKFRNIIESSPMGMHIYQLEPDDRLVFLDANPSSNLILGVDCQQFVGKTIEEAFPALTETEVPIRYRRAATTGEPWHYDQIDYDENGISGAFEVYAFQTEPNKMAVFFLDVTERKQAEEALRRSEDTLKSIFRAAPTGIGLVSDRKLMQVNERIYEMSGYSREELIGQNARILYPSDEDYEYVGREKYRQIEQFGTGTVETRWQHKDGHIIDVLMSSTPIDPRDLDIGVTFTALDITERKQAEIALFRSENTLSSIFRVAPTGIGLIVENKILQVNERVCEMIAYGREELLGLDIRTIFPTDYHFQYYERELEHQTAEHGSCTIETRWQCKDNNVIDVLFSVTPIDPYDLSMGLTFTALDISDRKQSEARIQRQMRRLAALNQIDVAITSNVGLDRTIDILLEQTVRQLNVDAAAILLYKPATQTLEYFAGQGFNTEAIKTANLRLGQDYAGRAALERKIVYATDSESNFLNCDAFVDEGFRCYYGVPLVTKGQVKGVLEVFHRMMLDPGQGWMSFLETLAGQAAIAIDGAELVDNLERSNTELRLAYNTTLEGWAKALELRDFETQGHSNRVTELTIQVARAIGISEGDLVHVQRGALLHDIGKMAVPDQILLKEGPLDDKEWEIMRQHPIYAYEMLSSIEFLRPALDIPYFHHEKWDGSGYPQGIKGEAIPLAARVFAIIDVWDALSSKRPYRPARPRDEVLDYIRSQIGKHFDPHVAEVFFSIVEKE